MKRISILVLAGLAGCQSPPEPTTLVRVRGCGGSTQGYVLVQPDGYVGSLDDLTTTTRKAAKTLQEAGQLVLGELTLCPR